jgi:hypothetical protein
MGGSSLNQDLFGVVFRTGRRCDLRGTPSPFAIPAPLDHLGAASSKERASVGVPRGFGRRMCAINLDGSDRIPEL